MHAENFISHNMINPFTAVCLKLATKQANTTNLFSNQAILKSFEWSS